MALFTVHLFFLPLFFSFCMYMYCTQSGRNTSTCTTWHNTVQNLKAFYTLFVYFYNDVEGSEEVSLFSSSFFLLLITLQTCICFVPYYKRENKRLFPLLISANWALYSAELLSACRDMTSYSHSVNSLMGIGGSVGPARYNSAGKLSWKSNFVY